MRKKSTWIIMAAVICAGASYGGISWLVSDPNRGAIDTADKVGCTQTPAPSASTNLLIPRCTTGSTNAISSRYSSIPSEVIPAAPMQQPDYERAQNEHLRAAEGIGKSKDPDLALQTLVMAKLCDGYDGQKKIEMQCERIVVNRALSLQVLQDASDGGDKNATIGLARALLFDGTPSSRAKALALLESVKQDNPDAQRLYDHLAD